MSKNKTFSFGDVVYPHEIGNEECGECWYTPLKKCECGGLIHQQFADESYDGYSLYFLCDKCDNDDEPEYSG